MEFPLDSSGIPLESSGILLESSGISTDTVEFPLESSGNSSGITLFQWKQELSHDSIARLNCALPITKTISVIR